MFRLLCLTLLVALPALAAPRPESRFGEDAATFAQTCRFAEGRALPTPLPPAEVLRRSIRAADELEQLNVRLWETREGHGLQAVRAPIKDHKRIEAEGRACVGLLARTSASGSFRVVARLNTQLSRLEPGRRRFARDAAVAGYTVRFE